MVYYHLHVRLCMCVRMFSARSVNDDDEGGNNSCDKYYDPQ